MVYHEIREVNRQKQNYLVFTKRKGDKMTKKSKFIGNGNFSKEKIEGLKKEFELEVLGAMASKNLSREQIIEIEKLKQIYNEKISSLSKEEFQIFANTFFTELTYDSNAIEGSSLSLEDTDLIVNESLVPEGKTLREVNEAKNHMKAIKFLESYKGDLTELFILKLHSIILRDISENFAGRYRENPVRIFKSNVSFPNATIVPQLVKNLVYWYKLNKSKMHPFELAIVFSMKLVSIHPFVDGNGRISRLIMNFLLKKKDYPWINIYMKQRSEYLKAVRQANNEQYKPILEFSIKSLKENLESFEMIKENK